MSTTERKEAALSTEDNVLQSKVSPGDLESTLVPALYAGLSAASTAKIRQYNWAFATTTFAIGPAFGAAVTYMTFQIQTIGYVIGHNEGAPPGSGCLDLTLACRVPFGPADANLTSVILYLNSICYAVSGVLTLFIAGWGDHFNYKREQYVGMLVIYGALCLPVAALTTLTETNYTTLATLYTFFNTVGFVAGAWMNVFVPYVMEHAIPGTVAASGAKLRKQRENEGLKTSVWGGVSMNAGIVSVFIIVIGVSFANSAAATNAGLYMTSAAGGVCIVAALVGWRFLPPPPVAASLEGQYFWMLPFYTFVDLFRGIYRYPEAFKFLIAFVIFNDSIFAFGTVTGTLFNLSIRPSLREYTLYSLAGSLASIVGPIVFLFLFPRLQVTLRQWTLGCYGTIILVTAWCLIGINEKSPVGFKTRAEFYVFQVVQNLAASILTALFRVLFPEMFPKGSEIKYFGFQSVLSLGTVWIPQIVNGPIVDATNNIRLPAVIALIFVIISFIIVWWMDDNKGIAQIADEEQSALQNSL